jgi:hypothetical protein
VKGPAGFGEHDVVADPALEHVVGGDLVIDVRPQRGSAAVNAGVAVPVEWPDSLRAADAGKPDIGALPLGAPMLQVGPRAAPKR